MSAVRMNPGTVARWRASVVVVVGIGALLALAAPAAAAPLRTPTKDEAREIRRAVLQVCGGGQHCRYHGARISAHDQRFAYASASGDNFSPGGILKRRPGGGWRFVIQESGGPDRCSKYRKLVPAAVLREFHVPGTNASNRVGRC